eukprot:9500084-Pyramimonas_sp.AAC.1
MARGVPQMACLGNRIADDLAATAAAATAIPPSRLSCYNWALATLCLVRLRIARTTLCAFEQEDRPPTVRE